MRRNDASINLKTGLKQIKQTSLKTFFFKKLNFISSYKLLKQIDNEMKMV